MDELLKLTNIMNERKALQRERAAARLGFILIPSGVFACAGPDHLTEAVVAEGGAYFQQFSNGATPSSDNAPNGGTGNNSAAKGGTSSSNSSGTGANTSSFGGQSSGSGSTAFDWGSSSYDANGGASVPYQGHFTGMGCVASCHDHNFSLAGTAYMPGGTATAANAQLGILSSGKLTTTYSGKQGNFFLSIAGNVDWATAQIAIRSANGTSTMAVNSQASGNCNSCHDASRRIVAP